MTPLGLSSNEPHPPHPPITTRHLIGELMDDPSLDPEAHRRALRGLARLNTVSNAAAPVWKTIRRSLGNPPRPFSLLDIASGSGDVLFAVAKRAQRTGFTPTLYACDISPIAGRATTKRAASLGVPVTTITADAINDAPPGPFDVAICTLFLHHLTESDTQRLLANMAAIARVVVVSDLVRSRRGLTLAYAASRVLTRSPVVHTDAIRSVRAAYTVQALGHIAKQAGLANATVRRVWPERMILAARSDVMP